MSVLGDLRARVFPGDVASGASDEGSGKLAKPRRWDVPLRARLTTWGLWVLLVVGVGAGVVAFLRPSAVPAVRGDQADALEVEGDPGGFGAAFVAAWLEAGSGTEAVLSPFYGGQVSLGREPRTYYASRVLPLAVTPVEDGYVAVTVVADVLQLVDESYEPVGQRFYEVGVFEAGPGRLAVTGLPAEVGAPERGMTPEVVAGSLVAPPVDDPRVEAVEAFLGAFLRGEAVDRYLAPGVTMSTPVGGFESVSLVGWWSRPDGPSSAEVAVVVEATPAQGSRASQIVQYSLRLRERAGRWEISELSGAPRLSPPSGSGRAPAKPPVSPVEAGNEGSGTSTSTSVTNTNETSSSAAEGN